jgi:RNA polymerase sigma-70 factor (ECF subfamily)
MSVDVRSDEELMHAYLSGEKIAIAILLTRRRNWMWNVARKTVRDVALAEDAVQEAMTAVFRKAHTFRSESKVSTWMYMIVQNACIDLLRKESVRPQLSEHEDDGIDQATSFADQSDTKVIITQALATLPEDQRIALTMTIIEGYSIDEAAAIAGVAPGTISVLESLVFKKRLCFAFQIQTQLLGDSISHFLRLSKNLKCVHTDISPTHRAQ